MVKHTETNCLSVFYHFVGLAFKSLKCFELKVSTKSAIQQENFDRWRENCEKPTVKYFLEDLTSHNFVNLYIYLYL